MLFDPSASNAIPAFAVINPRPQATGSIRALFDLELAVLALVLRDCRHHRNRDGQEWITLPSTPVEGVGGQNIQRPMVELTEREARAEFQRAALDAIHALMVADGGAAQ
jgi:hypothetical protein